MARPRLLDPAPWAVRAEMERMGVDPSGVRIMEGKARQVLLRIESLDLRAALILKQDLLSVGGEAALCRAAAGLKVEATPVLIMATMAQASRLLEKMRNQPFGLARLADDILSTIQAQDTRPRFLAGDRDLIEGGRTAVMGILNVTDDSFSDGGRYLDPEAAVARARVMAQEGADLIDVGGESTRPGARPVDAEEELSRVLPVIRAIVAEKIAPVSVDTTKAGVARASLEAGAAAVNDISGMTFDPEMARVAAAAGASVVLMHTRGRPDKMQADLEYADLMAEIFGHLERCVDAALGAGIPMERICVDPGIGFGKGVSQNAEIIGRLGEFRSLGAAVMVGVSKKSFIGRILDAEVDQRLEGSLAAAAAAVLKGANVVRAHDVAQTVRAARVAERIAGRT